MRLVVCGAAPDEVPELSGLFEGDACWQLVWVATAREFADVARRLAPDAVLVPLRAQRNGHALELIGELQTCATHVPIVPILTAERLERDLARLPEVADFLVSPLRREEVCSRLRRLAEAKLRSQAAPPGATPDMPAVVGDDPSIASLRTKLPLIARSDATVLITGETGTGKEVVARAIHALGAQAAAPFVPMNCGAIPTELFENELFGHRRGAYTDARTAAPGLIAAADGGTIFLDEIDSTPLPAQVKLLHFLQHKSYRPLGGGPLVVANVRTIVATNTDLEARVRAGAFREDLYYRLNIIPVTLPPLRERRGDVPLLAHHFFARHAAAEGPAAWTLLPEFVDALCRYAWPGNVRELENLVQQIVALTPPGRVGAEVLPPRFHGPTGLSRSIFREAKTLAVASFERDYAQRLLAANNGNVTRAARAAGKERRAFGRLLKKYGIQPAAGDAEGRSGTI